jgi:hypothetical protein
MGERRHERSMRLSTVRAPRCGGDHEVYLDATVLRAFIEFVDAMKNSVAKEG